MEMPLYIPFPGKKTNRKQAVLKKKNVLPDGLPAQFMLFQIDAEIVYPLSPISLDMEWQLPRPYAV